MLSLSHPCAETSTLSSSHWHPAGCATLHHRERTPTTLCHIGAVSQRRPVAQDAFAAERGYTKLPALWTDGYLANVVAPRTADVTSQQHSLSSDTMALTTPDCCATRLPAQHDGPDHPGSPAADSACPYLECDGSDRPVFRACRVSVRGRRRRRSCRRRWSGGRPPGDEAAAPQGKAAFLLSCSEAAPFRL